MDWLSWPQASKTRHLSRDHLPPSPCAAVRHSCTLAFLSAGCRDGCIAPPPGVEPGSFRVTGGNTSHYTTAEQSMFESRSWHRLMLRVAKKFPATPPTWNIRFFSEMPVWWEGLLKVVPGPALLYWAALCVCVGMTFYVARDMAWIFFFSASVCLQQEPSLGCLGISRQA